MDFLAPMRGGERAEFFQRADGENFPFTDANGFGGGVPSSIVSISGQVISVYSFVSITISFFNQ
mgnify:CR=1 FL=1